MPCYDPRSDPREEIQEFQRDKINNLTRLLCLSCKFLEEKGFVISKEFPDLYYWWSEHKKLDKERHAEIRKRVIERFTEEEKEAFEDLLKEMK